MNAIFNQPLILAIRKKDFIYVLFFLIFSQGDLTAQNLYTYAEGFENGLGIWVKGGGTPSGTTPSRNWRINSGATGSPFTGPTAAAEGNDYVYYETSFTSPDPYSQEEAWIEANFDFSQKSDLSLSISYHMFADNVPTNHQFYHPDLGMGDFYIDIHDGVQWDLGIFHLSGNQGNQWQNIDLDIGAYDGLSNITIRIRGTATNYTGDMAIDNIIITGIEPIAPLDYEEGFENGVGSWLKGGGNNARDWRRRSNSTPSPFTGPSSASQGNWYFYYETSFTSPNPYPEEEAWIEGTFNFENHQDIQLTFDYHMWADEVPVNHQFYHPDLEMGDLAVDIFDGSQWNNDWFSLSGNQGNQWHNTIVDLSTFSGLSSIKIRFRGKATNYTSDMAIDNIKITGNPIQSNPTDSDSELIAGSEPGINSISSLATLQEDAIDVMNFQIQDQGTSDGLPTLVNEIKLNKANSNAVSDLSAVLEEVLLSNTTTGNSYTAIIGVDEITFSNINNSIPDGSIQQYTLSLYLSSNLPAEVDGQILSLQFATNDISTGYPGSTIGNLLTISTGQMSIEVEATELRFSQQPSAIAVINEVLNTPPIITANDINGNIDLDFSSQIQLTNSAQLNSENIQANTLQGLASFDDFYFTETSENEPTFLTASSSGLLDANSLIGITIQSLPLPPVYQYSESFESDMGIWTRGGGNQNHPRRDWRRHSNATPSPFTGPDFAIDGNYYLYYETSDTVPIIYPEEEAFFEASFDFSEVENLTLSFDYHMRVDDVPPDHQFYIPGAEMGNLLVDIHNGTSWDLAVFSQSGDQNNTWRTAEINLSEYVGLDQVTIRFRGQVSHYLNDMAIDNIRIKNTDDLKVVVIGSSTAAGWGPDDVNDAWAWRYRVYLQGINAFDELANIAVPGKSTYHLMPDGNQPEIPGRPLPLEAANISAALALKPDRIIVNLPSNDASNGYNTEEQLSNFAAIYDEAQSQGIEIWIATPQPRDFGSAQQAQRTAIQIEVRDELLSIYGNDAIDFWTTLANPDGTLEAVYDSGDGTHLNVQGHEILYDRVINRGLQSAEGRSDIQDNSSLNAPPISNIEVYPNPYLDKVNISTENLEKNRPYNLSIYNRDGQLIFYQELIRSSDQKKWTIHLENTSGLSFLLLEESNGKRKWYKVLTKSQY